jgi:hypothetical protein
MGINSIPIKSFFFLILIFLSIRANSQEQFTKELKWIPGDSITDVFFQDTLQIINQRNNDKFPFAHYESKSIQLNGDNFFIDMVDFCSGLYCVIIYVFKKEDDHWRLLARTHATLNERLIIDIDTMRQKILFKTKSKNEGESIIGELKD